MRAEGLWSDPIYQQTAVIIYSFLLFVSLSVWIFKKKSHHLRAAWASINSWLFVAPFIFLCLGLPSPWPLVFLIFISIFSAKIFFKMTGMYHRSWFVWLTYGFIFLSGYLIWSDRPVLYEMLPMIFLGLLGLIPLLRNSTSRMIQYMGLSLMCFAFFGWSFLHLGKLLMLEKGAFITIYLYLLTEVSEHASLAGTRLLGRHKVFSKVSTRVSWEGMALALVLTLTLAWGLRHLLPDRSEHYWIAAGLVAAIFGRYGDLILTVIRRDLGVRDTGLFIVGRGDLLSRVDKLILVGPMYYYTYLYFTQSLGGHG